MKDPAKRAAAVRALAGKFGASMNQRYWTSGPYDLMAVIEAEDEESANAFSLRIGAAGKVRAAMVRAFLKDQMHALLRKMV